MARPGLGWELIERAEGEPEAKRRARWCIATLDGSVSVEDARRELDLSKQAFHDLRERVIAGAITGGTPRPPGRPPAQHATPATPATPAVGSAAAESDPEVIRLRHELARSQAATAQQQHLARVMLEGLRVREELHAVLGGRLKPVDPLKLARRFGVDADAAAQAAKKGLAASATPTTAADSTPP
jgi:hypothetical protein